MACYNGMESVGISYGYAEALVKKLYFFGRNIFFLSKNGPPPSFVKPFGLTSGTSIRGGPNFDEKDFTSTFIVYSVL